MGGRRCIQTIWGTEADASSFFPFLVLFGGLGQFGAALWSYRARAAVAAALHGTWGAFWLGVGSIYFLATTHAITVPARGQHWGSLGVWLISMSVISWTTAAADLAGSPAGFLTQAALGTGSAIAAIALLAPSAGWQQVAGWVFVVAAVLACYAGVAQMVDAVYGRILLPFAGDARTGPIAYPKGDPGVKVGQ